MTDRHNYTTHLASISDAPKEKDVRLEPQTIEGMIVTILGAIVAAIGVVGALVCGVILALAEENWLRAAALCGIIVGVLLADRFTRDDRRVWAMILKANKERDEAYLIIDEQEDENKELRDENTILNAKLLNASRPIMVVKRPEVERVEPHVRSAAWIDAMTLLQATADRGQLPGRHTMKWSPERQAAAIAELMEAQVVYTKGNINTLTTSVAEAVEALELLAG